MSTFRAGAQPPGAEILSSKPRPCSLESKGIRKMKKLEAELRSLRLQMEEDFLLTNERFAEMQRSMGRVESSLQLLGGTVHQLQEDLVVLQRDFGDFAAGNRAYHEGWHQERKRNMHVLDVLQTGLLTSGLETESRFDQIEARLRRLEEQQPGAA